jgi:hypothetical protein
MSGASLGAKGATGVRGVGRTVAVGMEPRLIAAHGRQARAQRVHLIGDEPAAVSIVASRFRVTVVHAALGARLLAATTQSEGAYERSSWPSRRS